MNKNTKKLIGPIIITILFCVYFLGIAYFLVNDTSLSIFTRWVIVLVPLAFAGFNIFVLIERIQEIKSGEEDDLSQY